MNFLKENKWFIFLTICFIALLIFYILKNNNNNNNNNNGGGGGGAIFPPLPSPGTPITKWFTEEHFNKVFPYAFATSVFTTDNSPFYTYTGFMNAIDFLETLSNKDMHGFCSESADQRINLNEMAAFLGNMQQETGDPTIVVPYPWSCPYDGVKSCVKDGDQCGGKGYSGPTNCCFSNSKCVQSGDFYSGCTNQGGSPNGRVAGGGLFLVEGVTELIGSTKSPGYFPYNMNNKTIEDEIMCSTMYLNGGSLIPNTNRGLFFTGSPPKFAETDGGCVMQGGFTCVSSDGTIYGNSEYTDKQTSQYKNLFPVKILPLTCDSGDKSCSCVDKDLTCEYVGRGPTQLTGNANYQACSLALFGDLRLVKYSNLLNTMDRSSPLSNGSQYFSDENKEILFGFPGGNVPPEIINSTPDARILIWATNIWFWMDKCRSGRTMSCHQCMLDPTNYGISAVGCLVNANPACGEETQTYKKYLYYKSVCDILGVESYVPVCTDTVKSCILKNTLGNIC